MADERAYGRSATALLKREASYGVDPGGNFLRLPYFSSSLGKEIKNSSSRRANVGRTARESFQEAPDVSGDFVMPLCMRNVGFLLTGLLGDPSTSGSGTYTHTFTSEAASLPSYALEHGHPSVPAYFLNLGVKVNTMSLRPARSGGARVSFGLIGSTETKNTSSEGGTPTAQTLAQASEFQGTIKQGSNAMSNLLSASLTISNNLELITPLNNSGNVSGLDPGDTTITGELVTRLYDDTLIDAANAGTPVDLDFIYQISASLKLTITAHEAYLGKPKAPITGPGGVDVTFPFEAIYNVSAGKALTAVLINDLAGTVYTAGP